MTPRLVSIQVGQIRILDADTDRPWQTAAVKEPVDQPVTVGRLGIEGDAQADSRHHGGIDKAVLAYSADHYPLWRTEMQEADLGFGAFAENLTIEGLDEGSVCLGDLWRVGDVLLEISQPRQPCWKMARRWKRKTLTSEMVQTGRCGWYLRPLEPGTLEKGMEWLLQERRYPEWTVMRAHRGMYFEELDRAAFSFLMSMPELSEAWRSDLGK